MQFNGKDVSQFATMAAQNSEKKFEAREKTELSKEIKEV